MSFGVSIEDDSLVTPMSLVHPLYPIKSAETFEWDEVFPPDELGSGSETHLML